MAENAEGKPIVVQECRPWVWILVIALSGICSGVTGLYTGSYTAHNHDDVVLVAVKADYDKRLADQTQQHQQEITQLSQDLNSLNKAVDALSHRVTDVSNQVNSVTSTVSSVSQKVEQHDQAVQQTQAIAQSALKQSRINEAKTDVISAKVDKTASAVLSAPKIYTPPVPAPTSASAPVGDASPWWHVGGGKGK